VQGGSREPCRRRHCTAQARRPHRRTRWQALRHGATRRGLTLEKYAAFCIPRWCPQDIRTCRTAAAYDRVRRAGKSFRLARAPLSGCARTRHLSPAARFRHLTPDPTIADDPDRASQHFAVGRPPPDCGLAIHEPARNAVTASNRRCVSIMTYSAIAGSCPKTLQTIIPLGSALVSSKSSLAATDCSRREAGTPDVTDNNFGIGQEGGLLLRMSGPKFRAETWLWRCWGSTLSERSLTAAVSPHCVAV